MMNSENRNAAAIRALLRENIRNIVPYSTARDDCKARMEIYLDANESPFDNGVNRYPSPHQPELKKRLSVLKGIREENIFLGNGSDEPIDLVFRLFCPPGASSMVQITPTYGMYRVAAEINDVEVIDSPLGPDFSLDASSLLGKIREDTKVIFLCSPNNPSGNLLDRGEILKILDNFGGITVVDEAYIDFSGAESLAGLVEKYPGLIVLQTLSKAWGMASVRCGMAFASEDITGLFNKVKYPYNINLLTQRFVSGQLEKSAEKEQWVTEILKEREKLVKEIEALDICEKTYHTDANFVLAKIRNADDCYRYLMNGGIIVRNRSKVDLCGDCLRITVGSPEENSEFIEAIRKFK